MASRSSSSFSLFIRSFYRSWATGMSGTASVPFTIAAFVATGKERIIYCFLAIACFVLASYLIWKKERDARMVLEDEKKPKLRLEFLGENDTRYYRRVDGPAEALADRVFAPGRVQAPHAGQKRELSE